MIRSSSSGIRLIFCYLCFWLSILQGGGCSAAKDDKDASSSSFVVAGYLPDYRFYMDHLNQTVLRLTDLILFSTDFSIHNDANRLFSLDSGSGVCCLDADAHMPKARQAQAHFEQEQQQALDNTRPKKRTLNVWLTVGGAGRSTGFATLLQQQNPNQHIPKLVQGLVRLCQTHGLAGIDLDYQGLHRDTELDAFVHLLQTASTALHKDTRCLLSTTLRPGMWLTRAAYRAVDRVHVMAYDHPHAPLDNHVKPAVEATLRNGVPPYKLVLGIPAYGRHHRHVNQVKTFFEIYDEAQNNSSDGWTTDARAEWQGYIFDSPAVVRQKAQYAKDRGLLGVFLWELGQDKVHEWFAPSGFLLQAAASVLYPVAEQQPPHEASSSTPPPHRQQRKEQWQQQQQQQGGTDGSQEEL